MFTSENDLKNLVDRWYEGTLPAKEWTHAAHVATCSYLVWNHPLADAYRLMKEGLYRFNAAVGTPNTEERGYHETLTKFWVTLLFYRIHRSHFNGCLQAANGMVTAYGGLSRADRGYYTFDVLTSKDARRRWIAPDVKGEVALEAFHWI